MIGLLFLLKSCDGTGLACLNTSNKGVEQSSVLEINTSCLLGLFRRSLNASSVLGIYRV